VERLGELGLLSMERGGSGRPHQCPLTPEGRCKDNGARLLAVVPSARSRGNGHHPEHKSSHYALCGVQRLWGLLLADVQKPPGCRPEHP